MKSFWYLFLFLFIASTQVKGQDYDSSYVFSGDRYGYNEWTDYMYCYRVGVGTQGSFYGELGISRLKYIFKDVGSASHAQYFSIEWSPTILPDKPRNIYGFKLGWESNLRALGLGIEGKYQTDFELDGLIVLTPKIGVGMFGIFNIFYGYHIWMNTNLYDDIGHHQLSLVLNLNRFIISGERRNAE